MKRELKQVPLDLINPPSRELRSVMEREALEELASSIKRFGVIEPIVVKKKGNRYEIIAGHRRFVASQMAGLTDIPSIVQEGKGSDDFAITLEENIQREDVSAMDIAKYLAYLYEERSMDVAAIAEKFNKSPQWVNAHLRLLGIDPMLQAAVEAGQMPYASALELQKIDDEDHRRTLARAAIQNGASHRTITSWVQSYRQQKEFQEKVASGEYISPSTVPPDPLKFECFLCKGRFNQNKAINIRVCPECYSIIRDFTEIYRKQSKEVEEDGKG